MGVRLDVMELVDAYVDAWFPKQGIEPDATPEVMAAREALHARLAAVEAEIEGYRADALTWRTRTAMQAEAIRTQPETTLTTSHPGVGHAWIPEGGYDPTPPKQTSVPRQTEPL